MAPVTDAAQIKRYEELFREMMNREGRTYDLRTDWVRDRGWKVVPTEMTRPFHVPVVTTLVSALRGAGCTRFLALTAERIGEAQSFCYTLSVDRAEFAELNRLLSALRFVLTDEGLSWAISCTEWYTLFAAKPELLEALLGQRIGEARRQFLDFASLLSHGDPHYPLLEVARLYEAL